MNKKLQILIGIVVIALTITMTRISIKQKPAPPKNKKRSSAVLVEAQTVERQNHKDFITAYGSLQAENTVKIVPQVRGKIVYHHPNLSAGLKLKKGEIIFSIEKDNYLIALNKAKNALIRAKLELEEEKGRKKIAEREWDLLDKNTKKSTINKNLVLRKIYLDEKKANVNTSLQNVKLASLDLERTDIKVERDGVVLSENIAIGQIVGTNEQVGTFAYTKNLQVLVSISQQQLQLILPNPHNKEVFIKGKKGKIKSVYSNLTQDSKMAQVLVEIKNNKQLEQLKFFINEFVQVKISTRVLKNIFLISNSSMRENKTIWTIENNKLKIIPVKVIMQADKHFYVKIDGKEKIDIITSYIEMPFNGLKVKKLKSKK